MRVPVAPFLQPDPALITHRGWTIDVDGDPVELPSEIAQWDYQATLVLTAGIAIDRAKVLAQCELDPASDIDLLVMVHSSATKVQREVVRLPVPVREKYELSFELALAGSDLGGKLTLETLIVVTAPKPLSPIAPSRPGSIIWKMRHGTFLEGSGSQFPTDAEDFRITFPQQDNAGWILRVDMSDLETLFMSAVRLTLNTGSPAVAKLLHGSKDPGTALFASMIDADVTRQLVHFALASDEVVDRAVDLDSHSLGSVLRLLLAQLWPATSPRTLRTWLTDQPERIETQIQHARRIGA